ncbi:MAG: penicillin-binding protein 2 [Candidatus Portnoybacteria bacterium]|nr:penicillin-binding protein 2 [Candidatus Portnoybacteria bacterium]
MDYLSGFNKKFKGFRIRKSFKEDIEPEEVLVDAAKHLEFKEQKIEVPIRRNVFRLFFGVISAGLLVLVFETGYFQVFKKSEYQELAARNSLRVYPILAPRGLIYDRNLKPLVSNLPVYNVLVSPQDLPKKKNERDMMIEQVSLLLNLNPKDVGVAIDQLDFRRQQRILLAGDLEPEKILELESRKDDFPAFSIEEGVARNYLYSDIFSHVLGHTGRLNQDELEVFKNYFSSERAGKEGLEAQYEQILRGQPGENRIEVDSKGRQIKELGTKEAVSGQNIVSTVDSALQKKIFEFSKRVTDNLSSPKGAIVAMDPRNGKILALLSFPGFNSNVFEQSSDSAELGKILEDEDQPLFNRAISGQYPSGSVIKPVIAAAALEEELVTPTTSVNDDGSIIIVNPYNSNVVYTFPDWKTHGKVNLYSAIAQSCDVYFYTIGGGYGNIEGLGVERIKKYLNLFGFGVNTGIDLPGEKPGLVPDEEWKQKTKNEDWYIGDTYHLSIGQGDLLVTPLQIASAISAIANGGNLYVPYLVDKIIDSDKNSIKVFEPEFIRGDFISPKNLEAVRKGMRETVVSGSGRLLADLPVKAAGKTGTAQVAGQKRENAWFVAFAPYENPEIVLSIVFENAGEGSAIAAPLAKDILNWYFSKN